MNSKGSFVKEQIEEHYHKKSWLFLLKKVLFFSVGKRLKSQILKNKKFDQNGKLFGKNAN